MIQEFVDRFMSRKSEITAAFKLKQPQDYKEIVVAVIKSIVDGEDSYGQPDHERVHQIDDGDYQGTLVFLVAANGYQPDDYWYVKVGYGSCSGCDTLEAIRGYGEGEATDKQAEEYWTLALHIVQGLKKLD